MFGLNRAEFIGRLGADVAINHLPSGGRVANMSIATDEGYINRDTGERVEKTEWHRVVTFQPGLIDMLEKHAHKGRLVYVSGTFQTRRWRKNGGGRRPVLHRDPARPRQQGAVPRQAQRRQRPDRAGGTGRGARSHGNRAGPGRRHPVLIVRAPEGRPLPSPAGASLFCVCLPVSQLAPIDPAIVGAAAPQLKMRRTGGEIESSCLPS